MAAALKSLETVGKGGGGAPVALSELGCKIEEFEGVCDEIYAAIAYTHTIVLERETQRELEKQLGSSQQPTPRQGLPTPTNKTPSSLLSSPLASQYSRSPLQKKTPPTPSSSSDKEKEKEEIPTTSTPTSMQIDDDEGTSKTEKTPTTPSSSTTPSAPTSTITTTSTTTTTVAGRLQLIKQLEGQLESAKRIRDELLSFTQDVSFLLPPTTSSTGSPPLLSLVDVEGADDGGVPVPLVDDAFDLLFTDAMGN